MKDLINIEDFENIVSSIKKTNIKIIRIDKQLKIGQFKKLIDALIKNENVTELHLNQFINKEKQSDDNSLDSMHEAAKLIKELLIRNNSIKCLYLAHNNFDHKDAAQIAEGLKANQTLTLLNLNNNPIGDKGLEEILQSLKDNKTLNGLHLKDTEMTEVGLENLVGHILKTCHSLMVVELPDDIKKLSQNQLILDLLHQNINCQNLIENDEVSGLETLKLLKSEVYNEFNSINSNSNSNATTESTNPKGPWDIGPDNIKGVKNGNLIQEGFYSTDDLDVQTAIEQSKQYSENVNPSKQEILPPEKKQKIEESIELSNHPKVKPGIIISDIDSNYSEESKYPGIYDAEDAELALAIQASMEFFKGNVDISGKDGFEKVGLE